MLLESEFAHAPGFIARRVCTRKSRASNLHVSPTAKKLERHISDFLREQYQVELRQIVIEQPPKVEMGEYRAAALFRTGEAAAQAAAQDCRRDCRQAAAAGGLRSLRGRRRRIHQRLPEARRGGQGSDARARACCHGPRRRRRGRRQRQDPGRAHQHQSQQGGAHRAPAQRHPGRHLRSPAAPRRPRGGRAELHRQHRRAGGRRGGRLHPACRRKSRAGDRSARRV